MMMIRQTILNVLVLSFCNSRNNKFSIIPLVSADIPTNNECENAVDLQTLLQTTTTTEGISISGSTVDATNEGINLCGENLINSPGVWYLYQHNNNNNNNHTPNNNEDETLFTNEEQDGNKDDKLIVHVSTCTPETDFDTAISIFSGYCTNLACVGGRDDDTECSLSSGGEEGGHSSIAFTASVGERYYIHIHGSQSNHTGNFGLEITETEPLGSNKNDISSAGASFSTFGYKSWIYFVFTILLV